MPNMLDLLNLLDLPNLLNLRGRSPFVNRAELCLTGKLAAEDAEEGIVSRKGAKEQR